MQERFVGFIVAMAAIDVEQGLLGFFSPARHVPVAHGLLYAAKPALDRQEQVSRRAEHGRFVPMNRPFQHWVDGSASGQFLPNRVDKAGQARTAA